MEEQVIVENVSALQLRAKLSCKFTAIREDQLDFEADEGVEWRAYLAFLQFREIMQSPWI